jgi:RHS repeat-associated protein
MCSVPSARSQGRAPRSGDPESESFLFTGEQYDARARDVRLIDADTGLYYLRARYYDPEIGRFLGQDPIPAVNLYAYVGNNPVNYVDPSGLCHRRLGYDQVCRRLHDKEGSSFSVECPYSHFVIINGACVPLSSCPLNVNVLLCPGQEGGWDIIDAVAGCDVCQRIAGGVLTYVQCTVDPQVVLAGAYAAVATAQPEVYLVVVGGGCIAVVIITETTGVNPLHP